MASSAKKRSRGSKASSGKRKRRHSGTEDDEPGFLSSKYAEPPTSKIYNSRFHRKDPAELFRKDLISAMKLPDSEPLTPDDYWLIEDSWKPEWEKGVQVPVFPEALPEPTVRILRKKSKATTFRLPKRLIHFTRNNFFNPDVHVMSYTTTLAERTCRYDMDHVDLNWLTLVNEDREDFGLQPLEENVVEQIIEEFEVQSYANFQEAIKSEEGLGVEYDEDAICDVCRSPDSQDGNEMVFCDSCNICVHQICYGITKIPEGSWVCRTCALGIRPACVLCPNRGGAMKTTRCGQNWAHVGCAVWIPEVSFFNFVKMEPITKISHIPHSRWALMCSLCKDKVGACIQCSEKNCKVAFHVTCAFQEGLQMRASVKSTNTDDDKLQAFCQKHSKKIRSCFSDSEEEHALNNSKNDSLTSEERANIRQQKIQAKEAEFYNYVSIDDVADMFEYDRTDIEIIYNYWKLKRRANWNRALLPPKIDNDDNNCLEENSPLAFLKKLVHRRQDLERARNLCYMAIKRERLSKRWIQYKEYIFTKQDEILSMKSSDLTEEQKTGVLNANFGDMAYDKKHTELNGPSPNVVSVLTSLVGEEFVKTHFNGAMKSAPKSDRIKSERTPNPYAKHYLNGLVKRSQRWLVDKQKKVSSLQSTLDGKIQANNSFQSSDHLPSDDGCDSSKDLHDLSLDQKLLSPSDQKFECFNANDNAFVNLETYHSSDTPIKEEDSTENCNKKIELCFPEISIFSQLSNDSTFACPSKILSESLDESMSDNKLSVKAKSPDVASLNEEFKSCSDLETEKQNFSLTKKESNLFKTKSKEILNRNLKSKKNIDDKLSNKIPANENNTNLPNFETVVEKSLDEIENIKLSFELPVDNCVDIETASKSPNAEISDSSDIKINPCSKPKLDKNIDYHNDDKLKSTVQCVIIKSDLPLLPAKSETVSGKVKNFKINEICDKPIKREMSEIIENGESNKLNNKVTQNLNISAKDTKIRPSSNKSSPLRTQSPTFKATENGLIKGSKSNPKQTSDKSQVFSKPSAQKSKSLTNSHRASSPVNKQHSPSSVTKCQDKYSSATNKNDESELLEAKDSCKETAAAPLARKDMLRGYKIPKKPRTEKPEENSLDTKRGNTPLSPLPDITSSSMSGYHTKGKPCWRKLEPRAQEQTSSKPRTNVNGSVQRQSSERLVLKLKKDTSDPESQRWKTDPNNFNRNIPGWMGGDFTALHPRLLPPPPPPPFLSHHPPRPWRGMRNRGGFRQIHMAYGNAPYT